MKIAVFSPKSHFTSDQVKQLSSFGEVSYTKEKGKLPLKEALGLAKGADVIGVGPDAFGGFEKAKGNLMKVIRSLPNLKSVCLSTTSFGWIDLDFCREREAYQ